MKDEERDAMVEVMAKFADISGQVRGFIDAGTLVIDPSDMAIFWEINSSIIKQVDREDDPTFSGKAYPVVVAMALGSGMVAILERYVDVLGQLLDKH